MGRIPRPLGAGLCYHVRVQCNNKAFRFHSNDDFERYVFLLDECRQRLGFLLHHYVIMSTHVHLILSTPGPTLLNKVMHAINQKYAYDYHKRHKRHGHFWINKYGCSIIDTDTYALTCMRYFDRNPMRAKIATSPEDWPWSSYSYYAFGKSRIHINTHESYLGLANEDRVRRIYYRDFVTTLLPSDEVRDQKLIRQGILPQRRQKL